MDIRTLNKKLSRILEDYEMEPQEFKWANKEMKSKIVAAPRGYSSDNDFVFSDTFEEIDVETAAQDISGFGSKEIDKIEELGFIDNWYSNYYIKCSQPNLVKQIIIRARGINKQNGWTK